MKSNESSLEKIVASALRRAAPEDAPLLAWPLACGSAVAERTRALEFSDGVLRVQVADAGWKAELQGLAPRYLVTLNRCSTRKVERIEFVVKGSKPVRAENAQRRSIPSKVKAR